MERFLTVSQSIFVAIVGVIFIAISAFCVVELSSRISAKSFVLSKIDRIEKNATADSVSTDNQQTRLSELSALRIILDDIDHLAVSGAEIPRQTIHAIRQRLNEQSIEESVRLETQSKIARVEELQSELSRLREESVRLASNLDRARFELESEIETGAVSGTGPGNGATAREIQAAIHQLAVQLEENSLAIEGTLERIAVINAEIGEANQRILSWTPSNVLKYNYIFYLQSDMILAISIILCGGIGAIFAASRSRSPRYAKTIFNGLLAGFIAFLIIKGGRSFFLVNLNFANSPSINPYAAAFSGILAGLFTEKAYRVLSDVTDRIGDRIIRSESETK